MANISNSLYLKRTLKDKNLSNSTIFNDVGPSEPDLSEYTDASEVGRKEPERFGKAKTVKKPKSFKRFYAEKRLSDSELDLPRFPKRKCDFYVCTGNDKDTLYYPDRYITNYQYVSMRKVYREWERQVEAYKEYINERRKAKKIVSGRV